ncbi:Na+/H+ antiporter subunit C [Ensifer soli]|uniref:Na+/H+ antiporter subunit C n=1 Tax=Ciceribacter sp. sgz301302 TaxID=3342379 RepID=UPI0035B9BC19
MEPVLAVVTGLFFAAAVYLMLSKFVVRILIGVVLLGNAVNLTIFVNGRLTREVPPVIAEGLDAPVAAIANPLPQALILTAIVISFSFFAFLLVLSWRAFRDLGVDDTDQMRLAEPKRDAAPPEGY